MPSDLKVRRDVAEWVGRSRPRCRAERCKVRGEARVRGKRWHGAPRNGTPRAKCGSPRPRFQAEASPCFTSGGPGAPRRTSEARRLARGAACATLTLPATTTRMQGRLSHRQPRVGLDQPPARGGARAPRSARPRADGDPVQGPGGLQL
ncbi:hypothetical protein Anae109_3268 [Anaeromyxobacter sp. Fw109-5]|nr:hypothetical protein Anae109_3268 [Anaeromyxobacter sp. Fw109-5]